MPFLLFVILLCESGEIVCVNNSYIVSSLVSVLIELKKHNVFDWVLFTPNKNQGMMESIIYAQSELYLSKYGIFVAYVKSFSQKSVIFERSIVCTLFIEDVRLPTLSQFIGHSDIPLLIYTTKAANVGDIFQNMDMPVDKIIFFVEEGQPVTIITRRRREDPFVSEIVHFPLRIKSSLNGITIRATAIQYPPHTTFSITKNGTIKFGGFFGLLWTTLEKHLNFRTSFCPPVDNTWGKKVSNTSGSWTGMIGQLQRNEADVAVSNIMMVAQRWDVIDYIMPQFTTRFSVFIKEPTLNLWEWDIYLEPFDLNLWFSILGLIVISSLYLVFLERLNFYKGNGNKRKIYESFFTTFGAFCMQGEDDCRDTDSCRIVCFTSHITAVILLSAYSATLVSFLIVQRTELPFKDLKGLLEDGTYQLGVLRTSSVLDFFQNSLPLYQTVYSRIIMSDKSNLVDTIESGLRRACSDKFAFMSTMEVVIPAIRRIPCKLAVLPTEYFEAHLSIAFRKNGPHKRIINQRIMSMRDSGLLKKIRDVAVTRVVSSDFSSSYSNVRIEQVVPVLCVFVCGAALAVALLWMEMKTRTDITTKISRL